MEEKELTKREFIKVLGGSQLMNDNDAPLDELVHPLSYSLDTKKNPKHPDMQAVPMAYKYQRNFKKLFDELKRT